MLYKKIYLLLFSLGGLSGCWCRLCIKNLSEIPAANYPEDLYSIDLRGTMPPFLALLAISCFWVALACAVLTLWNVLQWLSESTAAENVNMDPLSVSLEVSKQGRNDKRNPVPAPRERNLKIGNRCTGWIMVN